MRRESGIDSSTCFSPYPLSESVGDIGMMGGPLVVDVRDGMGDPLFSFASTAQILLPQDAPGSEKYPEAEYSCAQPTPARIMSRRTLSSSVSAARRVCWGSKG